MTRRAGGLSPTMQISPAVAQRPGPDAQVAV